MSSDVYANGNSIACKAGDGKVIASMPDVCLSPPSPPAGPVPIPYPNSSFSKDMQSGSTTVTIGGKEVMLKDKSFYKTSPLGDEAATRSFGGSVITHTITGKTYFSAWSMDVKFEGENVPRHLDLTTSNHNPYPGSTAPTPEQEQAMRRLYYNACPCCGSQDCTAALPATHPGLTDASGAPVPRVNHTFREWYRLDEPGEPGDTRRAALAHPDNACAGGNCPNAGKPADARKSNAPCDVYRVTSPDTLATATTPHIQGEGSRNQAGITQDRLQELRYIHGAPYLTSAEVPSSSQRVRDLTVQIDHRTPRTAGGCPTSEENTNAHYTLCSGCQTVDDLQDTWSNDELRAR